MKISCYSVRVKSLTEISDKAVKITCFDGSEDVFPKSQIFGEDFEVEKSEAYWISAWILGKKNIQYSNKKQAFFDFESGKRLPDIIIEKHVPEKINPIKTQPIKELLK